MVLRGAKRDQADSMGGLPAAGCYPEGKIGLSLGFQPQVLIQRTASAEGAVEPNFSALRNFMWATHAQDQLAQSRGSLTEGHKGHKGARPQPNRPRARARARLETRC
jgi:hypothetical protein